MQQADVVQESLNYKIELENLKKALSEKKKEQEREQLQLKASIDKAKRELADISVRFYYEKEAKAKKMDQTQQQYLVRESWKCKYRIDALKKELSEKKKKHKNDLLHVKDAISITQLNLRGIMARLKDEKRAAKKPATNEKVIPKAKLQQPTDDVCSVCFDHHPMCDVLQTSCGHQIGKECYQMWVNQCRSKHTPVTCTVCRRVKPKIFGFRERKTKKNAQMVA